MAVQLTEEAYNAMMADFQTNQAPQQQEQQPQMQQQFQPMPQYNQQAQAHPQHIPMPQQQMRMAPVQQQFQQPPMQQQRQRQMTDMVEVVYQDGGSEMVPRHVALQMGGRMIPPQQQAGVRSVVAGY